MKYYLIGMSMIMLVGCGTQKFYMKTAVNHNAKISKNITVAVLPENWSYYPEVTFFPRDLITEFIDMGFTVIERAQLETLLEEIKRDNQGYTKGKDDQKESDGNRGFELNPLDKGSIKEIGKMLGVDALLITYIIPYMHKETISRASIRLVDVQTAEILFSISFRNEDMAVVKPATIAKAISENIKQVLCGKKSIISKNDYSGIKVISDAPSKTPDQVLRDELSSPLRR